MPAPENRFKSRLANGEILYGLWMNLGSPVAAEMLSLTGYDWLMFDTEHAPVEIAYLQPLLQAAAAGQSDCLARPAWNDKVLIKRILDLGVQTVLIPFVQNADEAAAAVAAAKYPPEGIRGVAGSTRASRYGTATDYLTTANNQICVLVQIETGGALDAIESIAAVPGVDGLFIGPSDLSASLGHIGNPGHSDVQQAIQDAGRRISATGKAAGILATNVEEAIKYRNWGYRFISCALDTSLLAAAARNTLTKVRDQSSK